MRNVLFLLLLLPVTALADEETYTLIIKDHRFQPSEISIQAGKKVKLLIENQDATPEEFESHSLNREKIIAGKSKISIFIGPLSPGRYAFEGEFNPKTATGTIIVQ